MTLEDWKKVEAAMRSPFGRVSLTVDGYELTLLLQQAKPLKYVIGFYVNGWMKGEWISQDCEERRRFFCRKESALYSPAKKAKLTKGFRKSQIAKYFPDVDKKFTWYTPSWSSFASLKRHLLANNKSFELKECYP